MNKPPQTGEVSHTCVGLLRAIRTRLAVATVLMGVVIAAGVVPLKKFHREEEAADKRIAAMHAQLDESQRAVILAFAIADGFDHVGLTFGSNPHSAQPKCPGIQGSIDTTVAGATGDKYRDLNNIHTQLFSAANNVAELVNTPNIPENVATAFRDELILVSINARNETQSMVASEEQIASQFQSAYKQLRPMILITRLLAFGALLHWVARATKKQIVDHDLQTSELRATEHAKSAAHTRFLETITHEIRTPLTSIIGNTELMAMPDGHDVDRNKHIYTIEQNCKHLLGLIDGFFDQAKDNKNTHIDSNLSCCNIHNVMLDAIGMTKTAADTKDLKLSLQFQVGVPEWVITDPLQLRQILVNLINNAVRHTKTGGVTVVVEVSGEGQTQSIAIKVIDTGCGISDDEIGFIFDEHYQSKKSGNTGSAGLGLAICKDLTARLQGDIHVESTIGVGTVFTVCIPLHRSFVIDPGFTEKMPLTIASKPLIGKTVLLAEDSSDIQVLFETHLRKAGAEVILVSSGQAVVDIFNRNALQVDMVLIDIHLDGLDGISATRNIRNSGHNTPIIALTASTAERHRSACEEAGCNGFLNKPISAETLVEICSRWTHRSMAA